MNSRGTGHFVPQVLHQAKCIMTASQKRLQVQQQEQQRSTTKKPALPPATQVAFEESRQGGPPSGGRFGVDAAKRPKARSPLELFKADFATKLKLEGERVSVASKEFWQRTRAEWAALPEDRKRHYEESEICKYILTKNKNVNTYPATNKHTNKQTNK